ncbi:hypothetical protein JYB64_07580 [Algoriphagus aestuarii]|nr:hypothetical protein [Algoriphagus aestuarii]
MKQSLRFLFSLLISALIVSCQEKSPETGTELVNRSIEYHDPKGEWPSLSATFQIMDSLPNGRESRKYSFSVDNQNSKMTYSIHNLEYEVLEDSVIVKKGDVEIERALRMRNYYTYLWGLPMKLKDPGTIIDEEIKTETLDGKSYLVARVAYPEDSWYFYFDPENYRMHAYKFYKDEPNQVGEIIYLNEEVTYSSMKIPANRSWYRTEKPEFLGTDMLQEIR